MHPGYLYKWEGEMDRERIQGRHQSSQDPYFDETDPVRQGGRGRPGLNRQTAASYRPDDYERAPKTRIEKGAGSGSLRTAGIARYPRGMEKKGRRAGEEQAHYRRPDEDIRDEILDKLREDRTMDAASVEVVLRDGRITLNGEVDSAYSEQHLIELIDGVLGVEAVESRLQAGGHGAEE